MGTRFRIAILAAATLCAGLLRADLKTAKAQPNLEKRSQLAMDNAAAALKEARAAYDKGEMDRCRQLIAEVKESVELADTSLRETGKNPRRSPKWFKKAEMESRNLDRRIENFRQEMNVGDRGLLDELKAKVVQVHEGLLTGLMEGKKK
jgi:hypothetical protein